MSQTGLVDWILVVGSADRMPEISIT